MDFQIKNDRITRGFPMGGMGSGGLSFNSDIFFLIKNLIFK